MTYAEKLLLAKNRRNELFTDPERDMSVNGTCSKPSRYRNLELDFPPNQEVPDVESLHKLSQMSLKDIDLSPTLSYFPTFTIQNADPRDG